MKTFLSSVLATTAMAATAFAGSISLDSRAELEVNQYNDAAERVGTPSSATQLRRDNYRFALHTLRLDSKGNLNDATSFRLRFRLNNTGLGTSNLRDNLNNSVDYAYVQHMMTENLGLQVGKFGTDIGGVEGMTSGADLYMTSYAYNGTRLTTTAAGGTQRYEETNPFRYATGVKAIYTFADQELSLMATDQETDAVDANGAFYQNRNGFGVVYKGNFMDKTLLPVLSYHEDNLQGTGVTPAVVASVDKKYAFHAAGLRYEMLPVFFEFDYLYNTYQQRTTLDQNDKTTTLVGTLGTKLDNWVAKLKVESSETEVFLSSTTSTKPKIRGYQLALEYLPTGEKNFRYHFAYIQKDITPDIAGGGTATDLQSSQQVLAGVRLFADFLK